MTHVGVERRPVGDPAAQVPQDADDDHARLQRGGPSLHTTARLEQARGSAPGFTRRNDTSLLSLHT